MSYLFRKLSPIKHCPGCSIFVGKLFKKRNKLDHLACDSISQCNTCFSTFTLMTIPEFEPIGCLCKKGASLPINPFVWEMDGASHLSLYHKRTKPLEWSEQQSSVSGRGLRERNCDDWIFFYIFIEEFKYSWLIGTP